MHMWEGFRRGLSDMAGGIEKVAVVLSVSPAAIRETSRAWRYRGGKDDYHG